MRMTVALVVGLMLVLAAPAQAATIYGTASCGKENCAYSVVFKAAPGERNAVTVERPDPYTAIVRDTGAPITPGLACAAQADGSVRCANSPQTGFVVVVRLGDGDDVASGEASFFGEAGDDRITGNGSGGPGDDVLMNQSGFFVDDDGPTRGHDVYRSWDGTGVVSYETRLNSVLADVRPGQRSEDRLEGIKEVRGGSGDDVLIGDDGPNVLDGGYGRDRIIGGAGDDRLTAARSDDHRARRDVVDAGPGDDRIEAGASPGTVRCGPGADTVETAGRTLLRGDCEGVRFPAVEAVIPIRAELPTPATPFLIGMPACAACVTGRWHARVDGELVASVRIRDTPVDLRLNATGRRLLRRSGRLVLEVRHGSRLGPGFRLQVRWTGALAGRSLLGR